MGRERLDRTLWVALLVAGLLVGSAAAETALLYRNHLLQHEGWHSTKAGLDKAVMGAIGFVTRQQPLARNRLDLSAYHGFQEIRSDQRIALAQASFRVSLEPGAYLVIRLLGDEGFVGLRVSRDPAAPSAWLAGTDASGFTRLEPVAAELGDGWHEVVLEADGDALRARIDGVPVASFRAAMPATPVQVAFRAGYHRALLDDVAIDGREGERIVERFRNRQQAWAASAVAVLAVWIGSAVAFAALRSRARPRVAAFAVLTALLVALAVTGVAYAYQFVTGGNYAIPSEARRLTERYWVRDQAHEIVAHARASHETGRTEGRFRVLFLGSSQTWGAGASHEGSTFVALVEARLRAAGIDAECINGGVSGMRSPEVDALFASDWADFAPDLVVVNLSNNDTDLAAFADALASIASRARALGAELFFVLEANSPEVPSDLATKHAVMRDVAEREGIPWLDLHAKLAADRERGFLWWDFVHLADHGHERAATHLHQALTAAGLVPNASD